MLGGLPKLFDKNFVIAFLLPAALAAMALAWLFPGVEILRPLASVTVQEKSLAELTYLVLLIYGGALVLMMGSTLLYRQMAGYAFPVSKIGRWRERERRKRDALIKEVDDLDSRRESQGEGFAAADRARLRKLMRKQRDRFPPPETEPLPTRFGNVLAAFHSYPSEVYGASGPVTWLRLLSVTPKEFLGEIDDARAQVTCLMNIFYLLALVVAAALVKAAIDTPWPLLGTALAQMDLRGWQPQIVFVAALSGGLLLRPIYLFTVERAGAWGDLVKAMFDCYLPKLAGQLGYAPPANADARRRFWKEVSAQLLYRQAMDPALAPLADEKPSAPAKPRLLPTLIG